MQSLLGPIAVGLAGTAAVYPLTRKYDRHIDRKRKLHEIDEGFSEPTPKRVRIARLPNMARFRRSRAGFRRRRRTRRPKRGRRSFRRKGFARAVKRVILRTAESRKRDVTLASSLTTTEGDGTSRVVYIAPVLNAIHQGVEDDMYTGNKYWIRGVSFRGQVGLSNEVTAYQGALVRVTLIKSKINMLNPSSGDFAIYNSTTTSTVQPAQTSPFANPELFETTGNLAFTGLGYAIPFDRTKVKVLKSFTFTVNPGAPNEAGAGLTSIPTPFKLWFPINSGYQVQDPVEGDLSTVDTGGKWGSYYLVMQVIANSNDVRAEPNAEMDYRISVYFKDI